MKLALGSAQFGMRYGAFNDQGQPAHDTVRALLDEAWHGGIDLIDTASAYGDSEQVLGVLAASDRFALVTKVPPLVEPDQLAMLNRTFHESLTRLQTERVRGLLIHRAADLAGPQGSAIWRAMEALQEVGLVSRIGFSAYGAEEAMALLERYSVGIIQLPFNVFDHRHLDAKVLDYCMRCGVEVHVRSAFLQGFALANPARLTGHLAASRTTLKRFQARCREFGMTPLEGALRHVLDIDAIDRVIVGVDSTAQLHEILQAANGPALPEGAWADLQSGDPDLLDPSRWQ